MTTFSAVVTSHANQDALIHTLGELRYQTLPPDETVAFCSNTKDIARLREFFPEAEFIRCEDHNDWGHAKRAAGIEYVSGEWMGFFNDDDSYDIEYIEKMMERAKPTVDVVYCWWSNFPDGCAFQQGSSTSGNFIIRTSLAKEVGWRHRGYEADGHFIDRVARSAREIVSVPEVLYSSERPPSSTR